jgi:hypothetical protein
MSTMTEVIQKARRFIGYEYSQSVTKSACAAATENQVDDDDAAITKADKETIMAIDQRMVQLNKALIEYDAQHEQPPKKRNSVYGEKRENGREEGVRKKRGPTFPLLPYSSHSLSSPRSSLKKTKKSFTFKFLALNNF